MNIYKAPKNAKPTNYIVQAAIVNIPKYTDRDRITKAKEEFEEMFWARYFPYSILAEQEFLKVYDWYEEHGQMKFANKKLLQQIKKEFDKHNDFLKSKLAQKGRLLVYDYGNKFCEDVEKEVLDLRLTYKFYFERKGIKDCEIKSQIETAQATLGIYCDYITGLLTKFHTENHIDFSFFLNGTSLNIADKAMQSFADKEIQYRKNNLDTTKNYASTQAILKLYEKVLDMEAFNRMTLHTLKVNNCESAYIECEKSIMGIDTLKEKFNVE